MTEKNQRDAAQAGSKTSAHTGFWWANRPGRMRPMVLLWALGVPIPIVLVIFLIRGCV